jgi:hypothetical protein
MSIREELGGIIAIVEKDLKAYYFKPPNISWRAQIVCTGGKSEKIVHESVNRLYNVLDEYALFY